MNDMATFLFALLSWNLSESFRDTLYHAFIWEKTLIPSEVPHSVQIDKQVLYLLLERLRWFATGSINSSDYEQIYANMNITFFKKIFEIWGDLWSGLWKSVFQVLKKSSKLFNIIINLFSWIFKTRSNSRLSLKNVVKILICILSLYIIIHALYPSRWRCITKLFMSNSFPIIDHYRFHSLVSFSCNNTSWKLEIRQIFVARKRLYRTEY